MIRGVLFSHEKSPMAPDSSISFFSFASGLLVRNSFFESEVKQVRSRQGGSAQVNGDKARVIRETAAQKAD